MSVILASQYAPHSDHRGVVRFGKGGNTRMRFGIFDPQSDHLLVGKRSMAVLLAAHVIAGGSALATFVTHIGGIVRLCADKEMRRIYAAWAITAMQHGQTEGDWPLMQFIRDTVGALREMVSNVEKAVAEFVLATSPIPTFVGATLVNLRPKAIFNGTYWAQSCAMSRDKANGLAFDMSELGIVARAIEVSCPQPQAQ